jgi:hypothetical protein
MTTYTEDRELSFDECTELDIDVMEFQFVNCRNVMLTDLTGDQLHQLGLYPEPNRTVIADWTCVRFDCSGTIEFHRHAERSNKPTILCSVHGETVAIPAARFRNKDRSI